MIWARQKTLLMPTRAPVKTWSSNLVSSSVRLAREVWPPSSRARLNDPQTSMGLCTSLLKKRTGKRNWDKSLRRLATWSIGTLLCGDETARAKTRPKCMVQFATAYAKSWFLRNEPSSPQMTRSPLDLDRVVLDHGVGEELLAHGFDRGLGAGLVGLCEVELDHLALAHVVDAREAQRSERVADRLALGIEHARFERDVDARFHVSIPWSSPRSTGPSPREAGRGRDPSLSRERWEGEVCFRGAVSSVFDTHLTPLAALAPSPPANAGGEGICRATGEGRRHCSVFGPFMSAGPPSGRMPSRRATSW